MARHICILLLFADFKTSLLALVIANGGKVQINAPWGLVTSHPKSSAGILSTSYNMDINFFTWMFTRDVLRIILNKNWQIKLWRIYGHSPNSPMFPPPKFPSIGYNKLSQWSHTSKDITAQVLVISESRQSQGQVLITKISYECTVI